MGEHDFFSSAKRDRRESMPIRTLSPAPFKRGRWSKAERARLRELYGLRDDIVIAQALKRPVASVRRVAQELFRSEVKTGSWTASETRALKRYLGASSPQVIACILGRSAEDVAAQISALGLVRRSDAWTSAEMAGFKRIYGSRTDEALALIFGRSPGEIRRFAREHGLSKSKAFSRKLSGKNATRMPRWQLDELAIFERNYATRSNLELARWLGRSVKSVASKASALNLRKSSERLREMGRVNVEARHRRGVLAEGRTDVGERAEFPHAPGDPHRLTERAGLV